MVALITPIQHSTGSISQNNKARKRNKTYWKFPGSPVVRIQCFHCWGPGSIPGQGTKILQAAQLGQKTNKQNHNNKNMD